MLPDPVIVLNTKDIVNFAQMHELSIPKKVTKKGKERITLHFKPASLAVHPVTHEIFVISAVDRTLASFDRQGIVTGFQLLDEKLFQQAEGITFLPDATLVIINESANQQPTLLQFRWKPEQITKTVRSESKTLVEAKTELR